MRGLVEIKVTWLITVTIAVYATDWTGIALGCGHIAVLAVLAWPFQRVTVLAMLALAAFTAVLVGADAAFGEVAAHDALAWFLIGACYLTLYEFLALYEISSALRDYHVPEHIVCILNFGIRFIPIAAEASREAYLGARAKRVVFDSRAQAVSGLASAILVRLLHKFEDVWISYHVRKTERHRFAIRLRRNDFVFAALTASNLGLIAFV